MMIHFKKFSLGFLFTGLLTTLLFLTTLYFQILNEKYLFKVFEKHDVYAKIAPSLANSLKNDPNLSSEEKFGYEYILKNADRNLTKTTVEDNISQLLAFFHGKSSNFIISVPLSSMGLSPNDFTWSLKENAPADLKAQVQGFYGVANKILFIWFLVFVLTISIYLIYGKFSGGNIFLGGSILLITNGAWVLISGLLSYFFLRQMINNISPNPEPTQIFLSLLSSSLFLEITYSWIVIGGFIFLSGVVLFIINRNKDRPLKSPF